MVLSPKSIKSEHHRYFIHFITFFSQWLAICYYYCLTKGLVKHGPKNGGGIQNKPHYSTITAA